MDNLHVEGTKAGAPDAARQGRLMRGWTAFAAIFRQGTDPDRLSESIAWGSLFGMLPMPGLNSILCAAVAVRRKLNMGIIQAVNWLALIPQIALFLPMAQMGAKIIRQPPIPLTREEIGPLLKSGPVTVVKTLGAGLVGAIVVWAIVGIPVAWIGYLVLRAILRRTMRSREDSA